MKDSHVEGSAVTSTSMLRGGKEKLKESQRSTTQKLEIVVLNFINFKSIVAMGSRSFRNRSTSTDVRPTATLRTQLGII